MEDEVKMFECVFKYKGEEYKIDVYTTEYNLTIGNNSCDCNRCMMIGIEELTCGEEIELLTYKAKD